MTFTPPTHDDWENPDFAQHWDAVVSAAYPSRAEQLDILTAIVGINQRLVNLCGEGIAQ